MNAVIRANSMKEGDEKFMCEALEELFGFVANQCIVYLDGEQLDSLKKFNDKFYEFDSWEIYDNGGFL